MRRELGQLTRLEGVLGQEHEVLKQRDLNRLEEKTTEKQAVIEELAAASRERITLMKNAGIEQNLDSVISYLNQLGGEELTEVWKELEAALARCQKQNQINGMMLEKGKQHTRQLLGLLLGESDSSQNQLYDSSGATSSSFSNGRSVKV